MDLRAPSYDDDSIKEEDPQRKKFIIYLSFFVLVAAVGGIWLLTVLGIVPNPLEKNKHTEEISQISLASPAPRLILSQETQQKNLFETVKKIDQASVTGIKAKRSINYEQIQNLVNQAEKEPSLDKSYALYVKAYALMSSAFKETKDIKYIAAMNDLLKIVIRYPEYKVEDFPVVSEK